MSHLNITPVGDTLATISLGDGISEELSGMVVDRSSIISNAGIIGVTDVVPAYATVGVHYDPLVIAFDDLRDRLSALMDCVPAEQRPASEPRLHTVTVNYDGEDLDDVAARSGLSRNAVIELHSSAEYRVFVIGFVPGFAYLGQLDEQISIPRRPSPRPRVPAGSVAIADRQTAIYPSATPGGWHIIGRANVTLFNPALDEPSLFRVGDRVRFAPE